MARPISARPSTPPARSPRLLGGRRLLALVAGLLLSSMAIGCAGIDLSDIKLDMPFKKDEREKLKRRKNVDAALLGMGGHSKYIGDYISIRGQGVTTIQGVGLVNGLDGTGEDPPASYYRKMLLDDMRRMKIDSPESILSSPNTALVIVTAYIPPLIRKGERIDVEITLPEGSETTSLAGGWLLPCRLSEFVYLDGGMREGKELARSNGPVILFNSDSSSKASLKKGLIPGGAEYIGEDRNLTMGLRPDYVGAKMVTKISNRVSSRYHGYDKAGIKQPMAKPKTDSQIELVVHDKYRENYPRYLQVIRHMALNETPIDRHMRMQQLREQLLVDATSERAALELEGVGPDGLAALKDGLKAPGLEARFRAAEALAYLGNADGVRALQEAADKEPAFRAYALAALATLTDGDAMLVLRELMNHPSIETRYGAFRALSTVAPHDPVVAGIKFDDNKFSLHIVDSTAEPMIHVTRYRKCEVVLFNAGQEFLPPMIARPGKNFIVKSSGDGTHMEVTRIAAGERDIKQKVSRRVADVIRTLAAMGATYPDILQLLVEADRQHNLAGPIGIDALPQAGRVYYRENAEGEKEEAQIGGEGLAPNLFGTGQEERPAEPPMLIPAEEEKPSADEKKGKKDADASENEEAPAKASNADADKKRTAETPPPAKPAQAESKKPEARKTAPAEASGKSAIDDLPPAQGESEPPPQQEVPSGGRFGRLPATAALDSREGARPAERTVR